MLRLFNKTAALTVRSLYFFACFFDQGMKNDFQIIKSSIIPGKLDNPELIRILLLTEDGRFFKHNGIDIRAIIRASYRSLFCARLEGGSTIEQQYVRLITDKRDISLYRKLREMILATKLSNSTPKTHILSSYLSKYKFFGNIEGIEELAQRNNIDLTNTNIKEISLLIARLKYPFAATNHHPLLQRASLISKLSIINRAPQQDKLKSLEISLQDFVVKI